MGVALVTGASSGIGRSFARRLAAEGHGLVIVSRNVARLEELSRELRKQYGAEAEILQADLCEREQIEKVAQRLRDKSRPVDILVNNAGAGLSESFPQSSLPEEERKLDLLVRAVLVLTHAALPGMIARGRGNIIVVSSVAGFIPGGTYSAAKSWATTFTTSLAGRLSGTGVCACVLCPGFTRTEFMERAGIDAGSVPRWAWLDADRVVDDCLAKARKGRVIIIPSLRYKALTFLLRRIPLSLHKMLAAAFTGVRKDRGICKKE